MASNSFPPKDPGLDPFTGKELDAESSLQYFGARYYMAAVGRWGAVDPLADRYAGWSPYNYVLGNPTGLVDPDGRLVCLPWCAAPLIGFATGFFADLTVQVVFNPVNDVQSISLARAVTSGLFAATGAHLLRGGGGATIAGYELLATNVGLSVGEGYAVREMEGEPTTAADVAVDVGLSFIPGPAEDAVAWTFKGVNEEARHLVRGLSDARSLPRTERRAQQRRLQPMLDRVVEDFKDSAVAGWLTSLLDNTVGRVIETVRDRSEGGE